MKIEANGTDSRLRKLPKLPNANYMTDVNGGGGG
jgi:hypothetical protein